MKRQKYSFVVKRIIDISLFFLFACIPLVVNPFAYDFWYKPKIDSVYALIIIIIIAVSIRQLFLKSPLRFKFIPILIPLIAYAGSAIISTVFSIAPSLSLSGDFMREESLFAILAYVTLTFFFSQLVESDKQFQSLMKGLLVSSLFISLNGIINYLGYFPIEHLVPFTGRKGAGVGSLIGNPNFLGKYLVLVLPLFMAYYFAAKNVTAKILYGAGFLLCLCALVLTFTRASWLGFFVGFVIFVLFASRGILRENRNKMLASMVVIFVIAGISFCAFMPSEKGNILDFVIERFNSAYDFKKGKGVVTRLFVWEKAINIIQERPLIGFGPDTHIKAMQKFNLEYCLKFNDWTMHREEGKEIIRFYNWTVIDRAHNNYLDIAIGQGLIGLAAYMSIIITFFIWLGRTLKLEEDIYKRTLYYGIIASFCGYLVNDLFTFSVVSVSPTFWSLMGLTIARRNIDI